MENFAMMLVSGLGSFVQLFVLGICIYYVVKDSSVDAWFLLLGSMVSLLLRVFYMLLGPVFFNNEIISFDTWEVLGPFVGIIGVLADIMFGIGLILLVNKVLRK